MDGDTKVTAAIIAAAVSLIGAVLTTVVAVLVARWQVRSKLDELTQAQFKDVVAKRIEVYPRLWDIVQSFTSDWRRAGTAVDADWAQTFFARLNGWHATYGIFLSESAYQRFVDLRARLFQIVERCKTGQQPTPDDLVALDVIYSGDESLPETDHRHYGLATWLKNDLGSYKIPAIAVPQQ